MPRMDHQRQDTGLGQLKQPTMPADDQRDMATGGFVVDSAGVAMRGRFKDGDGWVMRDAAPDPAPRTH